MLAGSRWHDTGFRFHEHDWNTPRRPQDPERIQLASRRREAAQTALSRSAPRVHFALAAQGVPDKVIAEIVGHSDVRLTQNVYQHVYQEAKREAAKKMDELLAQISTPPENRLLPTLLPSMAGML